MSDAAVEAPLGVPRSRVRRTVGIALEVISLALIALLVWYLWPQSLGGGQQMVSVNGHSMEPTYRTGDLLIVRPNDSPEIGDILVYRIPEGEPGEGNMIVHRVIERWPDGTIRTQGDNRDTADSFHVGEDDVVGTPVMVIPHGTTIVLFAGSPLGLALIAGALMTLLLWPEKQQEEAALTGEPHVEFATVLDIEEFMADAYAWVESQLADLGAGPAAATELIDVDPWVQYGTVGGAPLNDPDWTMSADDWVRLELAELATAGHAPA